MIDWQQLHFVRPLWLLAALPALALALALWRQPGSGANWRRAIAPDLLEHLLEGSGERRNGWPWLALAGWLLATLAMAGPTWEKLPQPVLQKRDALVVVLDLSLSMYAEDVKPSRLQRARFKILDALQRRREGLTGLVVYSGDAHVVSPLTDDTGTIANLVPALAPAMMPAYGSDPSAGIDQALQLMRNAGFERGRVLLISDEITDADVDKLAQLLDSHTPGAEHWQLSILGVGTDQGAPIPLAVDGGRTDGGGFLKQRDGQIVIAQLHRERFERLAQQTQGLYSDLRVDDLDLDRLLPAGLPTEDRTRTVQREFDQWRERGMWLVIALLPLAALVFRRGWLLLVLILPLSPPAQSADATPPVESTASSVWRDLWQRPDQQAARTLAAGDAKGAAEKFRDPAWRGAALYRAGDYAAAATALDGIDNADADYNRGNALAHAGQLQKALDAYDAALKKDPQSADAKANRELVEKLLKQQQQRQQQSAQQNNSPQQDQSSQQNQSSQHNDDSKSDQQKSQGSQSADGKPSSPQQNQSQDSQQAANASKQNDAQKPGTESSQNNTAQQPPQDRSQQSPHDSQSKGAGQTGAAQTQADTRDQAEREAQQRGDKAAQSQQDGKPQDKTDAQTAAEAQADQEQQQQQRATEQWLRQVPDDPSGLLRRKFLYEHRQREREAAPRDDSQPIW